MTTDTTPSPQTTEFKAGETVYLLGGRECEYVAAAGRQHVVAPIYETEYGPETRDHKLVERVYREAPTEKLAVEVAALEARLADLKAKIGESEAATRDFERNAAARKARISEHTGLQRLDDYIAGKITHFVIQGGEEAYRIETFEKAMREEPFASRGPALRLLSLFGGTKGDLLWAISRYSDGSGSGTSCIPCTSAEEAEAKIRECVATDLAKKWAEEGRVRPWVMAGIVKCAKTYGVPVPSEVEGAIAINKRDGARDYATKKREELLQAEASLAAAERAVMEAAREVAQAEG